MNMDLSSDSVARLMAAMAMLIFGTKWNELFQFSINNGPEI